SQVDLENQRVALLRVEGEADQARGSLNAVMVHPIDAAIEPSDTLVFEPLEVTLDEVVKEASAQRPEVAQAALAERIRDELVGIERAEGRPRLDLDGAWGWSVRRPGNFLQSDFAKWNVSVTLKV